MDLTSVFNVPGLNFDDSSLETVLLEMSRTTFQIKNQLELLPSLTQTACDAFWEQARKVGSNPLSLYVHVTKLFFLDLRFVALRQSWLQSKLVALEDQIFDADEHLRLVALSIDGKSQALPLAFVIGESFDASSPGKVWFYSLQEGLQEQGDAQRFIDRMTLRLSQPAAAEDPLVQPLPPEIKERLAQGQTPQLTLAPLSESPFRRQVDDIRQALREVPVQDLLQQRLATRLRQHRHAQLPEWLGFLEGEERAAYELRERAVALCQQRVDEHLQGMASAEDYAAAQIAVYVTQAMGIDVDARRLRVRIRHALDIEGEVLHGEREMTLVRWLLSGGYHGRELQAQIIDDELAKQLTPDFVQHMIDELNVRLSYRDALQSLYFDGPGPQLMSDAVDARLALSALAARYQGLDGKAFEALEAARNHQGALDDLGLEVGGVILDPFQLALKDVFYLRYGQGDDQRVLFYSPGAPGADLRVLRNAQQLSLEIAGWTLTDQGQAYLLGQLPVDAQPQFTQLLKQVQRLPGDWSRQTITLERWSDANWQDALSEIAFMKVNGVLDQLHLVTPRWYVDAPQVLRQQLSNIDASLEVVHNAYQQLNNIEPFADYAHRLVKEKINAFVGTSGPEVDPDTVLVELEPGHVTSLTRTVISGYDSSFNFADFARITSTVGQNLSRLDRRFLDSYIRSAKLGEHYIQTIRSRLLDATDPYYQRRRLLHREVLRLQMLRAWLSETMAGRLAADQSQWLGDAINELLDLEPAVVGGDRTSRKNGVFQFALSGRRVEGVYLFRSVRQDLVEDLVYTPEAPGGLFFRTPQALARQWGDPALQDYFYLRVSIRDQPVIGSLIERYQRAGDGEAIIVAAISDYQRITDLAHEFDVMVERIVADVDEDTTSVAERISGLLFEVALSVVAILSIPFPPASLAVSVVMTLRAFVKGLIAYQDGDRAAATKFFLDAGVGLVSLSGISGHVAKLLSRFSQGPSSPQVQLLKNLFHDLHPVGTNSLSSINKVLEEELQQFLEIFEHKSMKMTTGV
ncbi:hypothetical protein ACIQUS_05945 [Pseudomonas sp. NPDC090755]|uniref:hypothetical protein n=1 Tax=Pseudomonas sp. NPDC090755 TaxID=3364481 RepID=UPI00383AED5B